MSFFSIFDLDKTFFITHAPSSSAGVFFNDFTSTDKVLRKLNEVQLKKLGKNIKAVEKNRKCSTLSCIKRPHGKKKEK